MKFKFILVIASLCTSLFTAKIKRDTITENLHAAKNPAEKIKLLLRYADFLSIKDFPRSIQLSDMGRKLAKESGNKTLEGNFLRLKGNAWYLSGKLDSASHYYYQSLALLQNPPNTAELASLYNDLGRFYRKTKDFPRSLKNYDLALGIFQKLQNEEGIATIYNESGVVYEYLGEHDEAINRYKKSLAIQRKRGDLVGEGYALEFIGGNYLLQKKYTEAENYMMQALEIRKKTKDDFAIALSYNVLGHLFQEQKKYSQAEEKYKESQEISQKLNYLDLQKDNYHNLAVIYRISGKNDLAYDHLEKFRVINDSIFSLGKAKQIEELSVKYETLEKEQQLLTEKSKVLKRNAAIVSLLGILFTAFIYYRNYQNKQKIKLQREILHQQDLAAKAVMTAEDNERKRMATHLHDGIGQLLTAANMNISVLNDYKNDENNFTKILEKTRSILSDAIVDVRTLSHQIMPNMLIKNSLSNALRNLIEKISSPKIDINLKIDGLENNLDQNIQVVLYRIIQEAINNTIKHSGADKIEISILQNNERIFTRIFDNGKGFDLQQTTSRSDGMGLDNIRSRIDFLKGKLDIQTATGKGTVISIEIPIS